MKRYVVTVEGNDGYENSIAVDAPDIVKAIGEGVEKLGRLTIEQIVKVEADYIGEAK
jgi:hypothetical protein